MKTFKAFLSELSEKESDAEYNLRMKKTTRTLKRSARKGKRNKKRKIHGSGNASKKIIRHLENLSINEKLIQKQFNN